MKVFITGASGFIGRFLCNYFIKKGWIVYGLSRKDPDFNHKNFIWIQFGIEQDGLHIEPVDFCIHTAALSPNLNETTFSYIENNVIGTNNVIQSIYDSGCKIFIFLSTVSVYGDVSDSIINEDTKIINPSVYGTSKYLSELQIIEQKSIKYAILRLPGVLGPEASTPCLAKIITKIKNNENIMAYNRHGLFNNAVHVADLSSFISLILLNGNLLNKVYVLGAKDSMKIHEIIDYILLNTRSKSKVEYYAKLPLFTIDSSRAIEAGFSSMALKMILKKQIQVTI